MRIQRLMQIKAAYLRKRLPQRRYFDAAIARASDFQQLVDSFRHFLERYVVLMVDEDGTVDVIRDPNSITHSTPCARRRRVTAVKRRPNFLRRRKVGSIGPVVQLTATEIIARN